jgi:hypothetical protein
VTSLVDDEDRRVTWRYTFCDLATRRPLAQLPLVGADLQEVIGGPAAGSGSIPLLDDEVRAADPWTATQPGWTVCFAQRVTTAGGREVSRPALWAGIVWKRVRSGTDLKLTMATPESYLGMRKVVQDRTFTGADDAAIQRTILADALAVPGGSMGGLAMPAVAVGTTSDLALRLADDRTVLDAVTAVGNAAPLEWRIAPGYDEATGRFTLTLQQATRLGSSSTRALVWTSFPGSRQANEALGYEVTEDRTGVPNLLLGVAEAEPAVEGDPATILRSVQTAPELASGAPLLEATAAGDPVEPVTQARLDRATRAELDAMHRETLTLTGLTVRGDRGPDLASYGLGDALTLQASDRLWPDRTDGRPHEVSGRLLGRRIQPGETGRTETVTMTLGIV